MNERRQLYRNAPALERFNPLSRIFFYDDFDQGVNGWCELIGNHNGDLNQVRACMSDLRPPQLSNLSFWDIGSHGALSGDYALKIATKARAEHMAQLIKRTTMAKPGLIQFETYFTFKAEQRKEEVLQAYHGDSSVSTPDVWDGNTHPSESDFGEFTFSNDMCIGPNSKQRAHCALRYINALPDGSFPKQWYYKTSVQPSTMMVRSGKVKEPKDYHVVDPSDWKPIPHSKMDFCYNELPSKVNWHYLRWQFDTSKLKNVMLQVNDMVLDLSEIEVPKFDHAYAGLHNLLNFCVDVRTYKNVRNFMYLDSILVSTDW